MIRLLILNAFICISLILSAVAETPPHLLPDESEPIRRFYRKTFYADQLKSGPILSNLWKRNTKIDSGYRFRRQFTSSADVFTSGTILDNLGKRKTIEASPRRTLVDLRAKPHSFQSADHRPSSASSLSHRKPRETDEHTAKGHDDKVRAVRQGYISNGYSLIQLIPGGSLSSSSSATILNNLWKKRQSLYYAEIPTFTNL